MSQNITHFVEVFKYGDFYGLYFPVFGAENTPQWYLRLKPLGKQIWNVNFEIISITVL